MAKYASDVPITRKDILQLIANKTRVTREFSANGLEKKAGVPKDTIRDFERGKAHLIRPDKLQKILDALGYDLVILKRVDAR